MMKKLLPNYCSLLDKNVVKPSILKMLLITAVIIFGNITSVRAQTVAADYTFAESIGNPYTDIYTLGTPTSIISGNYVNLANLTTPTNIGFGFVFNNINYTQVIISDNGFLSFGSVSPGAVTLGTPIASATSQPCVAAYSNLLRGVLDVDPNINSDVSYITLGSAGSRIFIVQYKNVWRTSGTVTQRDDKMNFQIKLYEGSNKIEVLFKDFTSTYTTNLTGQVGLRGSTNADFLDRTNNTTAGITYFYPSDPGATNSVNMITKLQTGTPNYLIGPPAGTLHTYTPGCINPTGLTFALQGDVISANLSWTAPLYQSASFTNYEWEVRYSGAAGSGAVGRFDFGTTTGTTAAVTGLSFGVPYILYVRSNCKPNWVSVGPVTPSCGALSIPYTQNFETAVVPAMPLCNNVQVVSGAAMVTRDNTSTAYYGFNSKNVITGSASATDTWYFTQGITLTPGNSYRLSYKYGGSRELAQFTQKMKVAIGTGASASVAIMTTTIADHNSIKASPITYALNFTVPGSGAPVTYFIGFNGYAALNQGYLQLDDISVTATTCLPPTALTAGQITHNSAIISWTSPVSAPAGGYEYYYGPTATVIAPIATTVASGFTPAGGIVANLSGLTPLTSYTYWVRSNCGGEASVWSISGTFTTIAAPPTPCIPAPVSVDGVGITNVTVGTINNTTGAETGNYGNYTNLSTNIAKTQTVNVAITYRTGFTYNTKIWIDWNNDGSFDDDQENVATGVSTAASPTTLTLSFVVPSSTLAIADTAGAHRMRIGGADSDPLTGYLANQGPCYAGASAFFGTFEDYMVYVTVAPPNLTVLDANNSTTTTFCSGATSPRVMVNNGAGSFTVYTWSPSGGVSGDIIGGYYFNPTSSTNYTLTATQGSAPYSTNTATYTVIVNPLPTPIVFSPPAVTVCQGIAQALTTSGGIVSGVTLLEENFNSPTNAFTTTFNAGGGGAVGPAAGAWTLRSSPYQAPPPTGGTSIFNSNDSSQFYLTNSDAQGSGGTTNTELISPRFDISTSTDAYLSFWHHYRDLGGTAEVQIANDVDNIVNNGEVYTTIPGYAFNSDQGSVNNFVNVVINLSPYITGGSNLRIKFKYINATFAWWWAIDNFKITVSGPTNLTWAPATGLYTNIAATPAFAYVLGTPVPTVYVKLDNDQTYTATATSTIAPYCSTSTNVAVTVTKLNATAIGDQTISCGGTVTPISLSSYEPTLTSAILRWESAFNPAFTGAITVPGSANQVTLTPALIGTVGSTTYYRAVVTGCSTIYSNTITITVNSTTWDSPALPGVWSNGLPDINTAAIIDGNLTIAADMQACSLQVTSGIVTVNPGVVLTVNNALNVIGGSLQFEDKSSLIQGAATIVNTNTGNIIYKRDSKPVTYFDYTYWSSPVASQTLVQSPTGLFVSTLGIPLPMQADKYYWFKNRTAPSVYAWTAPLSTTMDVGLGYIIRAPTSSSQSSAQPITATFRGKPNNGNVPVSIYKYGANDLNCIGNPYPSAISADAFVAQNTAAFTTVPGGVLGTTFYFWTHNLPISGGAYFFSDYATYNSTGATGTGDPINNPGVNNTPANGKIGAGQSFMVRGIVDGITTATFTNSMRLSGPGDNSFFFRSSGTQTEASDKHRVWLDLTNDQGAYKQILVGYVPNAINAYDNGFDGEALEAGNPITLYSIVDDKKLTIQGRALPFELTDQVPLGFMSPTSGNFTIKLSKADGLFAEDNNVLVYLEDKLLNTMHNLSESPYTFVTEQGVFDTRFVLRYSDHNLATHPSVLSENAVIAYKENGSIHVRMSNIVMKSVKIYDARGRLVLMQDNINSDAVIFANANIANQMLIIQVTSVDGVTINKKIIF